MSYYALTLFPLFCILGRLIKLYFIRAKIKLQWDFSFIENFKFKINCNLCPNWEIKYQNYWGCKSSFFFINKKVPILAVRFILTMISYVSYHEHILYVAHIKTVQKAVSWSVTYVYHICTYYFVLVSKGRL